MKSEIDGARIIKYTKKDVFGFVEIEDGEKKTISILAICSYDRKDEYYLFACDEQLNVLGDTLHYTIEEAMNFAGDYSREEIKWFDL